MQPNEEPLRIKLYGLFTKTKSSYLTQQGFALLMCMVLLLIWSQTPQLDTDVPRADRHDAKVEVIAPRRPPSVPAEVQLLIRAMNTLPWIVGTLLTLMAVETFFVLRAFARKEAERTEAERKEAERKEKTAAAAPPVPPPVSESPPSPVSEAPPAETAIQSAEGEAPG